MLRNQALSHQLFALALILALVCTRSVSQAAPMAAPPFVGDEIAISERSSEEYRPAIAYNSNHDEYLVVWENAWPGGHHDVYAQRVSSSGQLLSWFAVSSNSNSQMEPSVAYDPVHDRYLVVWLYDVWGNGSDWDVYGRFMPWSGPSGDLGDFMICNWNSNQAHPGVAYARAQEEYLVVWMSASSGIPSYISARRVFALGGFPTNNGFTVSSGPEKRDFPDVAYNLARNEYLVTWDVEKGSLDIYGLRLTGTGMALGGEFGIAGWTANEERPAVAACSQADQYLVAWQSDKDTGGTDSAIYARYLNGDAIPGNVYLVADTTLPQVQVDVAADASGQRYLLAWQDKYTSLKYGVGARGAYSDETMLTKFEVIPPGSGADREFPAIAGGRTSYLVAWEHLRNGGANRDIHGRLLRYVVYLPLVRR